MPKKQIPIWNPQTTQIVKALWLTAFHGNAIILFLTVSKNKIAATPENIGVVAILTVVLNYSILFPSFTFFLDGFHLAFGDKFEICIKTTDLM